jgi:hypothetical protein
VVRDAGVQEFFREFRSAVLKNEQQKVVSMVHFPFIVRERYPSKKSKQFNTQPELLSYYQKVFDSVFRKRIEESSTKNIKQHDLIYFIDNVGLWFDQPAPNESFKATSLNKEP